jgi:hypothetical protein
MAAKRDGEEFGLPLVEEARHGVLAMTFKDFLPEYAEAKLRLGFPYVIRVAAGYVLILFEGEVAAQFGPFRKDRLEQRTHEITASIKRTAEKEHTYTWVSGGLRQGWTGRRKPDELKRRRAK